MSEHPQAGSPPPPRSEVEFLCPRCRRRNRRKLWTGPGTVPCGHCGRNLEVDRGPGEPAGGPLGVCGVCGGRWLYLQRDFNQKVGCAFVLAGILASWHTYGLSLLAAGVVDLLLYRWLPWVTVCYFCQAHYRAVRVNPSHRPYDLQIGETTTLEVEQGAEGLRNLPLRPAAEAGSGTGDQPA